MNPIIIYSTFPNIEMAKEIAKKLLSEDLASCINFINNIESMYEWQGEIQCDQEVSIIIKTFSNCYDQIEALIKKNHSYECPCILSWPITHLSQQYKDWMQAQIIKS